MLRQDEMDPKLKRYVDDVISGKIVTCTEVKQAVNRFLSDLKRDDLEYRQEAVDRVIDFMSCLKHVTDQHAGKPFIPEPYQHFIIANLYGWHFKETGSRRFTYGIVEIARKAGKTSLLSALSLYSLIGDNQKNASIAFAANSFDQAGEGFKQLAHFAKGLDPDGKYLRIYGNKSDKSTRKELVLDGVGSIKVLSADATKLDGANFSFICLDEVAAATTLAVHDVLRSSQAMRTNPMMILITTAGADKSLPYYKIRQTAKEILQGVKVDDEFFAIIFTLDPEDDYTDENVWIKSNPSIDITVKRNFIRGEIVRAKNNPSLEPGIKTKNLNIWCDSSSVWIQDQLITGSQKKLSLDDFPQKLCFIGVDLASVRDFTAVSYMFIENGKYSFITKYYLPEDSLNTLEAKEKYRNWAREGFLVLTPGNVTDYFFITQDLIAASKKVTIANVAYDKYNSTSWAVDCTEMGLPLVVFSQSLGNFNSPTKEFERLLHSGNVEIDYNPITSYCFANVKMRTDHAGNEKPDKGLSSQKIDGVISILTALGGFISSDYKSYV